MFVICSVTNNQKQLHENERNMFDHVAPVGEDMSMNRNQVWNGQP